MTHASMSELLISCSLGMLLGVRHALEPDHLAAVSTLAATGQAQRLGRPGGPGAGVLLGAALGAIWGLGHTLALLVVGGGLALLHTQMPAPLADGFELLVAVLLLWLGLRALALSLRLSRQALRDGERGPVTDHEHDGTRHAHRGPAHHVHLGRLTLARRPLVVGLVHGLAGSGTMTALVLANLPSVTARLLYITLFGLGSVLGMALLSGLLGWPLSRLVDGRRPQLLRAVSAVTGLGSAAYGVYWGLPPVLRLIG
jgi:ABC-type nickel/cobalt efflux system permease component RcnA